ncbi:LuxR C-terminal-related transcriptional regulator, partial [Escherichia coli]|uniref:LuxR C-terminal-related transcriptional regulator n=9 Tax=Escherichia coli TaxID=562 RepID=UPI002023AAE9
PSGKNIIRWLLKKRTNGSVRYCQYTSRCSVNDISHLYRAFMSVEKLTLSGRQVNVLMMLLYGSNGTEGARYLGMPEKTFSTHKQNLIKRLRVHNEVELLYKGMLLVRKGRL